MIIRLYNIIINFFRLQISVKKQHTMVCKACNSHVHNTNDMTLVHLNECFNGKFNDDHCRVQNYLYCFSCKTVTPVHNNNNSCKAITPVHNIIKSANLTCNNIYINIVV